MTFTLVDVILILILFSFMAAGFVFGLIRSIGSLVGLAIGTWAAGHYFMPLAEWLTPILRGNSSWANIAAFFIVFIIINRLTVLIFHLIDKGFSLLAIVPFMKTINRLGGLCLGIIEGVLITGVAIYIIAKFAPDSSFVVDILNESQLAHGLVAVTQFLTWLLPEAFDKIKSVF